MVQRKCKFFSCEAKAQEAVDPVCQSGKGVNQIIHDLDVAETCLRD